MSSQEGRQNSLRINQQRTQQQIETKSSLKRIRIGEVLFNQQSNHNRTSLSLIQTNSATLIPLNSNQQNSIPHLDYYVKTSPQTFKNPKEYSQKGLNQYSNSKDPFEKLDLNDLHPELLIPLPPIKDQSKTLIESNNNVISQMVQSCKKFQINSQGLIPFGNMSPKGEKGGGQFTALSSSTRLQSMAPDSIHQLYQHNLKGNVQTNSYDTMNRSNQSNNQNSQAIINQLHNATSLQQTVLVKDKLSSLQGLCSPATLSSKKKKREEILEGKVESATPSSFSSRPDDIHNQIGMKKQTSEGLLKLIKTDSPLRLKQNSFFAKNSYFNNSNILNKTQIKDSQTYSSVDKSLNGTQPTALNTSGRKRATMQDFFTKRLKNNSQQQSTKTQNDDEHNQTSLQQSATLKKIVTSTTSIQHNKSNSLTNFPKLEDISKILQMQVSTAFTDVPRNRADLKELIKWFEKIRKQNEDENKYNIEEKRKKQLEIIQVCFKELSHQIRIDFLEREQFFKMVWNENVNYYKSFIEDFEQIKIKLNTESDSEYNRVSDFYKQYIKTKDMAAEQAFLEKRIAENKLAELKQEMQQNQQNQNNLKEEVNKFKKICMFLKKKLVTVTKEMEGLIQRQEDRTRHNKQSYLNEFYKEQLSQLKQQGANLSTQNEQTIQNLIDQLKLANENLTNQQKQTQQQDGINQSQFSHKKNEIISNKEDEEDEQEDDDNFTFEYNEGGDLIQGVDQLNAVIVNTEQEVKKECMETEVDDELRQMYMNDIEVQTDLYLVDPKFDAIMYDVETMNDIFDFYTYKQQMDEQVEKFDPQAFLSTLGDQGQQDNQHFVNTITQIRSMNSITESNSSSNSSSGSSSNSSSSSSLSDNEEEKKKKKDSQKKVKPTNNVNSNFLSVKRDYENLRGFQQRKSIRQRLSIRQNIFNSNKHLGLYLEQYLANHFINDIMAIFSDRMGSNNDQQQITVSSTNLSIDVPSMLAPPRTPGGQRLSFLGSIDSNPVIQKKRNELKKKLTELLEPEKLKTVLDDAGLKVTSSQTESKLEKFLKGQELQVQLKNTKQMLDKYQEDLLVNTKQLSNTQQLTEEQQEEIQRLEQQIRELQAELELRIAREKEEQAKKGTFTHLEESQQQIRHKQPRIFKPRREKKEVTAFQLGKKINIEWEFQKQQNSGKQIVEKAKNKKMAKFHNFMTVKTILKQITILYNERLNITKENNNYKDIEFSNFTYNYYSAQYGVKKIADQKFLILILSIKKYNQIFRINMFSKFLGLQEGGMNYSTEELNKYIDVLDFINNISQAGTNFSNNESEQKYLVPYIKAVHYISQFGDSRLKPEENQELRRDVEAMKYIDSNKVAVVDFDQYMYRMLAAYRILVNRAKQYVINAFNACDLDGNRKCNFNEWSLLNRHIEPDKLDDDQIIQIFEDNADIIEEDGEKNLSFDKFAVLSLEQELFSDETQDRYLEVTNPLQFRAKYDNLMQIWHIKQLEIQQRFKKLENIEEDAKEDWLNIINVLNEKLSTVPFSISNVKPLLIAYNILDKESHLLELDNIEYKKNQMESIKIDQEEQKESN